MTTIDLTPTPLQYEIMVGQTWDFEFQLTDDSVTPNVPISLANKKFFGDIKFENVFLNEQLSLGHGIEVANDLLSFSVKKDWRTVVTENSIEKLTPALDTLSTGQFKLIITVVSSDNSDTVTICVNINVVQDEIQK